MLELVDLSLRLEKSEYKELLTPLGYRLNELQLRCRAAGIPVVVVFEGWDAAGKGGCINRLIRQLDPRAFQVHFIGPPAEEERLRPFLWRFAVRMPVRGRMALFDRSWYGRVLQEHVEEGIPEREYRDAFEEIVEFERRLFDDGYLLVKFWLHISHKEQKKRFKRMSKNRMEAWKLTKETERRLDLREEYTQAAETMLARTSRPLAPWTIVETENKYFGRIKVFETLARAMESALARHERQSKVPKQRGYPIDPAQYRTILLKSESFLKRFDLSLSMKREEYREKLDRLQKKARQVHHQMYLQRQGVVAVFEGWDAAGKGGAIRRLIAQLDPRGFEVIPISAPTQDELSHYYLWRFWRRVPKAGHLAIYDRSWYGRVLVERIEELCTTEEWQRAYREITEFERCLTNSGIVVLKFWHHIDKDEQLRRFKARQETPHKRWKISDEDWRNRERWEDYELAVADMIQRTSTTYAPWTVVESNCKLYSRIKVLRTFVDRVSAALNGKDD